MHFLQVLRLNKNTETNNFSVQTRGREKDAKSFLIFQTQVVLNV